MIGNELVSFNIISWAGDAKSYYYEAIELAREYSFEEAREKVKLGEVSQLEAHRAHMSLLTESAQGKCSEIDILLIHAEDQLMMTEMTKMFALEMIHLYSVISEI